MKRATDITFFPLAGFVVSLSKMWAVIVEQAGTAIGDRVEIRKLDPDRTGEPE